MATHAHSTTVPVVQTGLLSRRDARGRSNHELPPAPLSQADTPEAVRSDIEALLADHGRGIHFKRALHKAFDFGFALLDALDLSPLALDAIDDAIATLDALDADGEDREDDDPAEGTSLERFGRGFIRAGEDDAEDSDPAERDDHHGTEDDAFPWRRDPTLVAFAAQVAHA